MFMKKIIFFLLSVAFVFNSTAQSRKIDSLQRALAAAKEDTNKVKVLVALSYYDGSFENGLQLAQEGLALAKN